MKARQSCVAAGVLALAAIAGPRFAQAHGIEGDRFFPPTLATDDPFAVDELAIPNLSYIKNEGTGGPSNHEYDLGIEFDKEIFPYFALGVSDTYVIQKPHGAHSIKGLTNLTLTAKYEFHHNEDHEMIASAGLEANLGGVGSAAFSDSFTTLAPTFYFGKGFGDLPDSLSSLRPLCVTTKLSQTFPTSGSAPNEFDWGFAVEYSLPYLQQHVRDIGLGQPFKGMIPLVEFSMATTENRGVRGLTTGTINPGVLYVNEYYELGVEAVVPVNHETGAHVGVNVELWVFIDDLFPRTFGHPLFGGERQ